MKRRISPSKRTYITAEVKSLLLFHSSNYKSKIKGQFIAQLNLIKENWNKPKEIHYYLYSFIEYPDFLRNRILNNIQFKLKQLGDFVNDSFNKKAENQDVILKIFLLNIKISFGKNELKNFMQNEISPTDIELVYSTENNNK